MPHTILRLPTVKARTGLSRSTIYHRVSCGTFPAPVPLGAAPWAGSRPRCTRGSPRGSRNAGRSHPGSGGSNHDPSQEGGPSITPRHTTPAPVAPGRVRALAHGRRRGRTAAEQTAGAPRQRNGARRMRMTVTGRGDAHPVPQRKGGRHDPEHHR